jgi:hypothetical protein
VKSGDLGWVKNRIQDKHPGFATLEKTGKKCAMFRIQIHRIQIHRIHMFLGLPDPDPFIIKQK